MDMTKARWTTAVLGLLLLVLPASAANEQVPGAPPGWFLEHNEFLTRDGGVFHTDNAAYRSEGEPWDAYGLEWTKGPSGLTLHGRLFGLRDGEDVGTFWEFYSYWNPEEGRAYLIQVGGHGAVGLGFLEPPRADGTSWSEQTFHHPDGTTSRVAHEVRNEGDVHATRSLDWADGAWAPRRSYVWHRVRREPASGEEGDPQPLR